MLQSRPAAAAAAPEHVFCERKKWTMAATPYEPAAAAAAAALDFLQSPGLAFGHLPSASRLSRFGPSAERLQICLRSARPAGGLQSRAVNSMKKEGGQFFSSSRIFASARARALFERTIRAIRVESADRRKRKRTIGRRRR